MSHAPRPIASRFWPKVQVTPGCWLWQGHRNERGYGKLSSRHGRGYSPERAHHVAWELAYGPPPRGLCVLHRCDVRHCVRPDHLFLGTVADNQTDMARKGRGTVKLTAAQVREARILRGRLTQDALAAQFGVCRATISHIQNGRNWRHLDA